MVIELPLVDPHQRLDGFAPFANACTGRGAIGVLLHPLLIVGEMLLCGAEGMRPVHNKRAGRHDNACPAESVRAGQKLRSCAKLVLHIKQMNGASSDLVRLLETQEYC